jgi:DNA polymerase elongation subunit (family B)
VVGGGVVKGTTVYVKPHKWECTTSKAYRGTFEIRAWGLLPSSEPVAVRFLYHMPLMIELDPTFNWDESGARRVYDRLSELQDEKGRGRPVSFEYLPDEKPLYSAYLRKARCIRMRFSSWHALDSMKWLLAERKNKRGEVVNPEGIYLWDGQDPLKLRVRDDRIHPDICMLIEKGMETTSWFQFEGSPVRSGRITRLEHEYVVQPAQVRPTPDAVSFGWKPRLKELVIDAEAFAERSTAMPKSSNPPDAAFCVGALLRHRDGREEMHAFCSVKRPNTPRGVKIHYHDKEYDALKAYAHFIRDSSPDVIGSHNGMGWDEIYLWERLGTFLEKWPNDSRLLEHIPELVKREWDSSAYSGMRFYWVDRPGIVHNDLLAWSKRSLPKLDSYKLDYLDKRYGGTGKLLGDEDKAKVDLDDVGGKDEEVPEEDYLEAHKIFEYYLRGDPEELKRIVVYCVGCLDESGEMVRGDCGITLRLMDKLQTWMQLTQMAKVAFVQPFDVFTRGMQFRTYNQVAREAHKRHMFMSADYPPLVPVKGAHVFPPMRGLWNLVFVFDFKGLYPSIIRRYNIDVTTYVPERGDPHYDAGYDTPGHPLYVPDDRCNVFTWEEEWREDEYKEWVEGKKKSSKKAYKGDVKVIRHHHRFLKEPRGILPANLDKLANDREEAKAKMRGLAEKSFEWNTVNLEQDAIKLVMNSAYGGLGSKTGQLRLHPGASVVTYVARCSAQKMAGYFESTYDAKIVYGDSVTPDTPVLCRLVEAGKQRVVYRTVDQLAGGEWVPSDHGGDKEESPPLDGMEVWTERGFTRVRRVIRHACGKPLVRVRTRTGVVDVTTDHSLLLPSGEKVKPSEVCVGSRLLHHDLPDDQGSVLRDPEMVSMVAGTTQRTFTSKLEAAEHYREMTTCGWRMAIAVQGGRYTVLPRAEGGEDDAILSLETLPAYTGHVYDLETDNHHFSAGIGRLVVHNTDSAFIWFPPEVVEREGIRTDPWRWGLRMAREGSALFEKPMELEFEKVFEWLLLVNKKQYMGPTIPAPDKRTGVYPPVDWNPDKMISRGLMFVKRGAAPVMQQIQKELVVMALTEMKRGTPQKERQRKAMELLEAFSYKLMSHGVPEKELTITQKIGQSYKQAGNALNVYKLHLIQEGRVVNPGDRIPYVLIKRDGKCKQGDKMELPELRKASGAPIDYLYYLEKRGVKPYESVLGPGFGLGPVEGKPETKVRADGTKLVGFMTWHVKFLKGREKLLLDLLKRFGMYMDGRREIDYRRRDAADRERRRERGLVRMSAEVEVWHQRMKRRKAAFGGL